MRWLHPGVSDWPAQLPTSRWAKIQEAESRPPLEKVFISLAGLCVMVAMLYAMLGAMDPGTIVMFLSTPVIPVVLDRNAIANPLNKILTKVGPSVLVIMVASIALPHIVGDIVPRTLTMLHELFTTSGADEKNGNDKAGVDFNATTSGGPESGEVAIKQELDGASKKPSRATRTSSMPGVAVDKYGE